jgi:glycosyltransferase involved in cell wall biosynthesis
VVLFLHNRYRTTGGEERVVEELMWLVRERLREPAELIARDSAQLGRGRAALGLLGGGLDPGEVAAKVSAVRNGQPPIVHAHNLQPSLGWRALAGARRGGARVVLHLHQYRLVCAVGVCFTGGAQCTRCHGRNTLPGVLRGCRGNAGEAVAYALGLALWQRRLVELSDAVIVPSEFALARLRELGAPLPWERTHVIPPPLRAIGGGSRPGSGRHALVASRLAPEKGVDTAIAACKLAGLPLVIAGDGPQREQLERQGGDARFEGQVDAERMAELRRGAALALVPSRSENFSTAAAEAMAAGLPVVATRVGGMAELVPPGGLVPPGDPAEMAAAAERLWGDAGAGEQGLERVRRLCSPETVGERLREVYRAVRARP